MDTLDRHIKIRSDRPGVVQVAFGLAGAAVTGILCLYMIGLGILGLIDGGDMYIPLLPFSPANTAVALFVLGAAGLAAAAMAIVGGSELRGPLVLWTVGLCLTLVAAIFRSGYRFDGPESFQAYLWLLVGAIALALASWVRYVTPPPPGH